MEVETINSILQETNMENVQWQAKFEEIKMELSQKDMKLE